ncbi:DUF2283 domain-containing protein [Thioalkalicoccus limnaeus]|uniref:DUF2283 domain-containing protein n=1 Tax=Thioalkalicoccus limnaeus TaxID=120681 RepID=A0ABV4BH96_9GAMM
MKLEFDPIADAAYFEIARGEIAATREIEPGINGDYDAEGHLIGIEVLGVSKRSDVEGVAKAA